MTSYRLSDLPSELAELIEVDPTSGCWLWQGELSPAGYGIAAVGGRRESAHKVVFELLEAKVPSDRPDLRQVKSWGCRSKACCWPAHLLPVVFGSRQPKYVPRPPRVVQALGHRGGPR